MNVLKKKKNTLFEKNVSDMTEILNNSAVGIAGCGGLGSNAAVALVRAGVGKLVLVDFDKVEESNLNRQYYFQSDLGKKKVNALSKILKSINPYVQLEVYDTELRPENVIEIFGKVDLLIEAFDKAESKQWLIEAWCENFLDKPIICGNGLSGLGRTDELKVFHSGNIYFCGDGSTDMSIGLCSSRIAIVANMQANVAIEYLVKKEQKK